MSDNRIVAKPASKRAKSAAPVPKSRFRSVDEATPEERKKLAANDVRELFTAADVALNDPDRAFELMRRAVGLKNVKLANHLLAQISMSMNHGQFETHDDQLIGAIAIMQEIKPDNVTEALLAVQIIGVHHAAMKFLYRAALDGQTFEGAEANVLRATRLMRVFTEQLDAMAKLKGKSGQQKVTVEHVHVHQGGRAIVGAVVTPKAGEGVGGNGQD
jgi:hypothetical protein